ncbi:hypothetical protein M3Y97_00605700 [Aphelenchoides bicaudatus]|nr:hypothetical protein M3Y97_00605700 [Aphelenchoides bicaudatus]
MSKLDYEVVEASGRSGTLSSGLLKTEEWISEPYCRYPQVLVVRFPRTTQVGKIEMLVNRKYIPSRMDLYAAASQSVAIPPVHLFNVLGNITFKEKKSDTGRHELKTIFIDVNATYLKFSFGRNYNSTVNPKNQIGIVELNVFAAEQTAEMSLNPPDTASTLSIYKPGRGGASSRRSNFSSTKSSSVSSSLSTSSIWRIASRQSGSSRSKTPSKQSQALAELKDVLRRAEQAKINAIDEENYALAKQARRAEIQLELILKQIRDVERAKQKAIDEDDFDRAQELTDQIRVLRDNAFEQVDIKFLSTIPNDPRPSSSQTSKSNVSSSTTASSILRQFQDGRLKIDSTPLPNTVASAFQPIPLTPSTISEYPRPDQLPPKTQSSLASSTTISFHSDKSGSDTLSGRHSNASSQTLTPSPHPDVSSQVSTHSSSRSSKNSSVNTANSAFIDPRPILPDSRLPNIRRLSDPTVYRSDGKAQNDSTSNSLASRFSAIFQPNRKQPKDDQPKQLHRSDTDVSDKQRNRFLEKENQVVPGARRKKSTESITLDALMDGMHPSERQIAGQAIDFFGLKTISRIYSKNWRDRQQGYLQDVTRVVESLVVKGLNDKLYSVYSVVLNLLKQLLGTYVVQNGLVDSDGPRVVNSTYQLLVNRTGDTVNEKRFAAGTFDAIASLLDGDFRIANQYMSKFMQPFDSNHSVRTDQGKAKIVYDGLVSLYNARLSSLSTKNACQFALECLNHTDATVRDYGRKIVVFLYEREDRQQVRANLPKGNSAKKVPAIRNLLDDLDKMDSGAAASSTNPPRQTRFDTNPTIINGNVGKKKRSKSSGAIRSPNRSPNRSRNNSRQNNVRLMVDDKKVDDKDPVDYNKQQPRPESDNTDQSFFSLPALRSILKNK